MSSQSVERAKILVVDDDRIACNVLSEALAREGYDVRAALSGEDAVDLARKESFEVVITDLRMKDLDGIGVLKALHAQCQDTPVIVITAFGSMDSAVEAIQAGAYDYLSKPFKLDDIRLTVRRAIEHRRLLRENRMLKQSSNAQMAIAAASPLWQEEDFEQIIGESSKMIEVYKLVARVALSDSSVLVQGESGTGKELIARAIHNKSPRRNKPFLPINCGALTETLLESELFGHERGAFTGAVTLHKGIFEAAEGGTCFLDEISEMSPAMQIKLLRVLELGEIKRVGSSHPIKVDVRIIAASNKNLEILVKDGLFREDLFYRLNAITISLPPLRERIEDIPLLVRYFLRKYSAKLGKQLAEISPEAMRILMEYTWGGNVRELENVIERAVTLSPSGVITPEYLPPRLLFPEPVTSETSFPLNLTLQEMERRYILAVLERVGGNKTKAAEILGIDRKTLRAKLAGYNLQRSSQNLEGGRQ